MNSPDLDRMGSCSKVTLDEISIIIPVKDNQQGINHFLDSFFQTHQLDSFPREIIIVDNNSDSPVFIPKQYTERGMTIQLFTCDKPGPASARNFGAKHAKGKWLLFVDSDCIPTESMIKGYLTEETKIVAYQGVVEAIGVDYLSRYYMSQQIYVPPSKPDESPKYLITANALVLKKAFDFIGGFNEQFTMAGGEDIELAMRLVELGELAYAKKSRIIHDFNDGLSGFVKRFIRYGKGVRLVKSKHDVSFYLWPFRAKQSSIIEYQLLALLQWFCWFIGYTFKSVELLVKTKNKRPKVIN